jgi:hypothetical protein
VASYYLTGRAFKDKGFDPIPEGVDVHDNQLGDGGGKPAGESGAFLLALLGTPIPDIVWDGVTADKGRPAADRRVVFRDNGPATFANLHLGLLGPVLTAQPSKLELAKALLAHRGKVDRDIKQYAGDLKPLPPVKLPGGK